MPFFSVYNSEVTIFNKYWPNLDSETINERDANALGHGITAIPVPNDLPPPNSTQVIFSSLKVLAALE